MALFDRAPQAGSYRTRVLVLRAAVVDDGLQRNRQAFAPVGDLLPAARRDLSDGERFAAGMVRPTIAARYTIRQSPQVSAIGLTDRLRAGGADWEIIGIKEVGHGAAREITARVLT
ncbi:head-tail adaptor protein [Paracoccus sp. p3-h83]|uniref:phage head completion protein n=1 Tax=Paracoccus sp. p3-h83 TaxID=3342805 RepID=UPI0035BB6963